MTCKSLIAIICVLLCTACQSQSENDTWAESTAIITVTKAEDGEFDYTIKYDIPESTAVNRENKPIKGPIEQYALAKKKPIDGQRLKMRYLTNEPVIFELLESIRFE